MKNWKKRLSLLTLAALSPALLAGCGEKKWSSMSSRTLEIYRYKKGPSHCDRLFCFNIYYPQEQDL